MSKIVDLREDIRKRAEADRALSPAWLLIYILPIILAFSAIVAILLIFMAPELALALLGLCFIIIASLFIAGLLAIVLIYKLIARRNTHFARQHFLYEDSIAVLKDISSRRGIDVSPELMTMERGLREARMEEAEKSAALWAILSWLTSIAVLYVYYFLMRDFRKHEWREDTFFEAVSRALMKLGITYVPTRRERPIPDRSFWLYLIVTILTLGLFAVYWVYALIKDPNEHFKHHIRLEDELLRVLEAAL